MFVNIFSMFPPSYWFTNRRYILPASNGVGGKATLVLSGFDVHPSTSGCEPAIFNRYFSVIALWESHIRAA